MAIKLIGTPSKIPQTNHSDLGNNGDHYEQIRQLGKIFYDSHEEMKSFEAERETEAGNIYKPKNKNKYRVTVKGSLNGDGTYTVEARNKHEVVCICQKENYIQGSQSGTSYTIDKL